MPRRSCLRSDVKNEEMKPPSSSRKRLEPPDRFERVLLPLRERDFLRLVVDPLLLRVISERRDYSIGDFAGACCMLQWTRHAHFEDS
jgi:hypothetical protein